MWSAKPYKLSEKKLIDTSLTNVSYVIVSSVGSRLVTKYTKC